MVSGLLIAVVIGCIACGQVIKPVPPVLDDVATIGHVLATPAWPNAFFGQTDSRRYPSELVVLPIPGRQKCYLLVAITHNENRLFVRELKVPASTEAIIPVAYELKLDPFEVGLVDSETWDKTVKEVKPTRQLPLGLPHLYGDVHRHVVVYRPNSEGPEQLTMGIGKTVRESASSYDGEWVAILFGEGASHGSMFFERPGFDGRCIHQFYRRATGQPEGNPVIIPFCKEEGKGIGSPVWSPDSRCVIYFAANFSKICVIPVKQD